MASLPAQDVKALETLRQRLAQLASSLAILQNQILHSDPLPSWQSLHAQNIVLSTTLLSLSSHLEKNAAMLNSTAVYPLPLYPGSEQEDLLGQLLRKKLEPRVEDWVNGGTKVARRSTGGGDGGPLAREWVDLWMSAGIIGNEQARSHDWGGNGSDDDDEEDEDSNDDEQEDKMQGVAQSLKQKDAEGTLVSETKMLPISQILRFMAKGTMT